MLRFGTTFVFGGTLSVQGLHPGDGDGFIFVPTAGGAPLSDESRSKAAAVDDDTKVSLKSLAGSYGEKEMTRRTKLQYLVGNHNVSVASYWVGRS